MFEVGLIIVLVVVALCLLVPLAIGAGLVLMVYCASKVDQWRERRDVADAEEKDLS